tara:strand:+ start:29 stop:250 length:222 start_codon:yes stop_codon:yes gene_type:complete
MEKVYVVFGLQDKDFINNVYLFGSLEFDTSYGNLILEPIREFSSNETAEEWVKSKSMEDFLEYEGIVILGVFR